MPSNLVLIQDQRSSWRKKGSSCKCCSNCRLNWLLFNLSVGYAAINSSTRRGAVLFKSFWHAEYVLVLIQRQPERDLGVYHISNRKAGHAVWVLLPVADSLGSINYSGKGITTGDAFFEGPNWLIRHGEDGGVILAVLIHTLGLLCVISWPTVPTRIIT